jgi:hypothetical protein
MLRPDLWWWNAARVDIDQRAREARLRLEHLERLLISRVLPTSRPRQALDQRRLSFFGAGCARGQSTKLAPPEPRYGQTRPIPTEMCVAVNRLIAPGGMAGPRSPA